MFFSDLKSILNKYKKKEITKEDYNIFLNKNIIVDSYIPIAKKYAMINSFCSEINKVIFDIGESNSTEIELYYLNYDINIVFSLLFGYTNIIISGDERNIENYDLIITSGFFDYVYEKCGKDYDDIVKKCNRLNGIDNLWVLSKLDEIFCNNANVKNMEKIKDIINNEIDKDKLKFINSISEINNPKMKDFLNNLEKSTVEEVKNRT